MYGQTMTKYEMQLAHAEATHLVASLVSDESVHVEARREYQARFGREPISITTDLFDGSVVTVHIIDIVNNVPVLRITRNGQTIAQHWNVIKIIGKIAAILCRDEIARRAIQAQAVPA